MEIRRLKGIRAWILGLIALAAVGPVVPQAPAPSLPASLDAEIDRFLAASDLKTLLGQVLMVGVQAKEDRTEQEWARANDRLAEMVRTYQLGSVLLFEGNFPPQYRAKDLETPATVAGLTRRLQEAAFQSQKEGRKIPLLIAMDQEGGNRMIVTSGVTRIPSPVFLGNARSEPLARQAGAVIGGEMGALGVNTVFAPVVDVNNNAQNDVIGRRAFGARPDLVAQLASAFAHGLRDAHVLAVAKHFPGHGTSAEDPHGDVIARQGYDEFSYLQERDLPPFARLVADGVDGVMTAHILSPIDSVPVTYSAKAIDGLLRRDATPNAAGLGFRGVVFTDDLTSMMSIIRHVAGIGGRARISNEESVRARAEIARRALEAGSDVLLFGQLWLEEDDAHPERSLTPEEFHKIYLQLLADFRAPERQEILKRSVRRILAAKARFAGFLAADLNARHTPWDESAFRARYEENQKVAVEIVRRSAVVIREGGRTIDPLQSPSYFAPGKGPLSKGVLLGENDRLTVVGPAFRPPHAFYEAIVRASWLPREQIDQVPLVYGWRTAAKLAEASRLWGFPVERLSLQDDQGRPDFSTTRDAIRRKADQILARSARSRVVVFGVLLREHVEVLREVFRRLDPAKRIVVVTFLEPYFLLGPENSRDLFDRDNAIFLYTSPVPDPVFATRFLYGEPDWMPHDVSYLSILIPGIADRGEVFGAAIETETKTKELKKEDRPETRSEAKWNPTQDPKLRSEEQIRLEEQRRRGDEKKSRGNLWAAIAGAVVLPAAGATGILVARLKRRRRQAEEEARGYPFQRPAADVNNVWYRATGSNTAIVFVHGIFSDSRTCWFFRDPRGRISPNYWPHLIEGDPRFGDVAIFLGGYYTAIDATDYDLASCATELRGALHRIPEKPGEQRVLDYPRLLFVCHSTGGIVVRYLLERHADDFARTTVGLLLIASPSLGAPNANRFNFLSRFFRQKLARQLRVGSEILEDLHSRFKELVNSQAIHGLVGKEAYEHHWPLHWKWLPSSGRVVEKGSAGVFFGPATLLPGTDHFSAVKPDSPQHPAHKLLVDFWTEEFAKPPAPAPTPAPPPAASGKAD